VAKGEGGLRDRAYAVIPMATSGVLGFLAIAFNYALALNFRIMDRWLERPYLIVFPLIGAIASIRPITGAAHGSDLQPFRPATFQESSLS
jgi:cytochrome d ubiquinol oxidase subunit II